MKTFHSVFKITAIIWLILTGHFVWAHAEHDKPRYVSAQGIDKGECDSPKNPCRRFSYVAAHANKGDQILVASGRYDIDDADSLFYLLSELLPVKAGFSTIDDYQQRNADSNPTYLTGVPPEFADRLRAKGFTVNTDSKGVSGKKNSRFNQALAKKLTQFSALSASQSNVPCTNGQAGDFSCDGVSLLAHLPLAQLGLSSTAANDIWGFVDLNNQREYAIIGLNNGIAVVDVTNPTAPVVVGNIASQNTIWRDMKVYQYYDATAKRWKAYAYVTADSVPVGLMIVDLTGLPNGITLGAVDQTDRSAHNVYISNVSLSTGVALTGLDAYLHIIGSDRQGGAYNSYALNNPLAPNAIYVPAFRNSGYTHDGAAMVIDDQRVDNQCSPVNGRCEIFLDFSVDDIVLWDKTNNAAPNPLSQTTYPLASYIHSGWWTEDNMVALVHDEVDEQRHGLNTTLRLFDLTDLSAPSLLSVWTGPTRATDHNGFVRGNRYYMSNYERGLTILDISNPAQPVETGFFDTYPLSDNSNFNGAWGVYPYLPSGHLLVSDSNSGLYILADETVGQADQDSVSFDARWYNIPEGENLSLNVKRIGTPGQAVSVQYETHSGSAGSDDFTMTRGTLNWAANDSADKSIVIATTADSLGQEETESLSVRLYNPVGGLALTAPNVVTVYIDGLTASSHGEFLTDTIMVKETDGNVVIPVVKVGNFAAVVTVDYDITPGTASENSDYEFSVGTLTWAAHESGNKQIVIKLLDDEAVEGDENLLVTLSQADEATGPQLLTLVIRDDESNLPAQVNVGDTIEATAGGQVVLAATATDPEGFAVTYLWSQLSGNQVSLQNSTASSAHFIAPSLDATLVFEVSVSDDFAAVSRRQVTVNVTAASPPSGSGGGGSMGYLLLLAVIGGFLSFRRSASR